MAILQLDKIVNVTGIYHVNFNLRQNGVLVEPTEGIVISRLSVVIYSL